MTNMESRQAGITLYYLIDSVSLIEKYAQKNEKMKDCITESATIPKERAIWGGYSRSRIVLAKNIQKELYLSAKAAILMEEKISR